MKINLKVNGQEMTFSEEELIAILEKHFGNELTERGSTEKVSTEVARVPTVGEPFEVDPQAINQELFQKKWEGLPESERGSRQGETCKRILKAFEAMKNNPEKYGRKFKTMMPEKTWAYKTIEGLKIEACKLGDHNADWVEQALEWAQRICNGESWEDVCDNPDTADWYRLVLSDDYHELTVGGSRIIHDDNPASFVEDYDAPPFYSINDTVPLVVLY